MSTVSANWFLRAGWVFPVTGPPIRDGVVGLEHPPSRSRAPHSAAARIALVARAAEVAFPEGAEIVNYPGGVVVPAFVNAHAHAELAPLAGRTTRDLPFVDWLREVIALRADAAADETATADAIRARLSELVAGGCTTIGDFVSMMTPHDPDGVVVVERAAHDVGLRAVLYSELIGFAPDVSQVALERLRQELDSGAAANGTLRGAAPHAPYSASPAVYREALAQARARGLPFSTHASEFEEEREFLATGGGPCAELLKWRGNWDPEWHPTGQTPIAYLESLGALEGGAALAHCNLLTEPEIEILARTGSVPVHCPGTHDYFQRDSFDYPAFERYGVPVALGTDSMASNAAFDMRAEARLFHNRFPDVAAETVLQMLTVNGAKALGLDARVGAIEIGMEADLCVFQADGLPDVADTSLSSVLFGKVPPILVIGGGGVLSRLKV